MKTISARDVRVHFSIQILDPGEKREFDVVKLFFVRKTGGRGSQRKRESEREKLVSVSERVRESKRD